MTTRPAPAGPRTVPAAARQRTEGPVSPGPVTDQPITVLLVFGVMDRGGAELRTLELMRHLDPERFRLIFVTLSGRPGALAGEIHSLGGEVYPCGLGPGFPTRFRRLLEQHRPDVVNSCVATFSGAVLTLARRAAVPRRIAYFHSSGDRHGASPRGRAQRAVMRRLIDHSATDLVGVAEATMVGLWRADWRDDPRCQVIYNGLDLAPYARVLADRPVGAGPPGGPGGAGARPTIVHVGRPGPEKNRARAIDVLAALRRGGTEARLLIVGRQDLDETAELRHRAAAAGVADAVELTGERSDVPRLLAAADLMLLTSRSEGLPGVVLEARAAGTPVLATELPGIAEIAALLGGVTMTPLSAPDEAWARAARAALDQPPSPADRVAALRTFADSPFTIGACLSRVTRVWSAA